MSEEYDHPWAGKFDTMGRDPSDEELDSLSDHELAELFRDVAGGAGSVDLYDRVTYQMVRRFDEYEAEGRLHPRVVIDGRFTPEGVSVSAYVGERMDVADEAWFTWDETEELRAEECSDFTFELGGD